ncbi:hypothetical protein [Antrihabitans cavernicola]|uniref:Uncharacterized protein n=1 Tax=Antrihabitans cavernicola TaxID=2495913 RepID=A0A5A7S2R7_9NOCA|nr:hypothetical protein [Spelaeibacter cavernicola]KAA0017663.1 hypothetical protein FOY51_24810 [Spelaeibacter cavernicola]
MTPRLSESRRRRARGETVDLPGQPLLNAHRHRDWPVAFGGAVGVVGAMALLGLLVGSIVLGLGWGYSRGC